MDETNEKLDQCVKLMQDTSNKTDEVIGAFKKSEAENSKKDKTIEHLLKTVRIQSIVCICALAACFLLFIFGCLYSPYMSQITQSGETSENQVQIIGG